MERVVSESSTVVVAKDQISCNLADEAVVLNFKAGMYYGLNSVAAKVWSLIQEPKRVSEIRDAILAEYAVDADRCQRELFDLLRDLQAKDLIRIKDARTA
jgi:coenzyme PQQ synthesis protein D (PqqD)